VVVSTASTLTRRTRGHRPQVFNVVRIEQAAITVAYQRWDGTEFRAGEVVRLAR
jgi:hypothetical protein